MVPKIRAWDKTHQKLGLIDADISNGVIQSVKIFDDDEDDWQEADNFILMQSTNMKDKNGVEIYDGDIVKLRYTITSDEELFVVKKFRGGSWRIDNRRRGCELWLRNENCEVVGNIHENLELVEELNR